MNKYLFTIAIAPMTNKSRKYPTRVSVRHDDKTGWIILDQIRTIDKKQVIKPLGRLSGQKIREVFKRNLC